MLGFTALARLPIADISAEDIVVVISATADQSLSISQTATAAVLVNASAAQSLSVVQSATAIVQVSATAAQTFGITQAAAVAVVQTRLVEATQSLGILQNATAVRPADLTITDLDLLHLPINCVMAGNQLDPKRGWRTSDVRAPRLRFKTVMGKRNQGG